MTPPNYNGYGLMDLTGYDAYLSGKFTDYELPQQELTKFTKDLDTLPKTEMRKNGSW
jgi:tryptophan synthase beta chain